jgi:ankyrin repeat protein
MRIRALVLFTPLLLTAGTSTTTNAVRSAAQSALALLQTSQKNWNQSCTFCHHQVLPALAFRSAGEHGIRFDEAAAAAANRQAFGYYSDLDRAVQYTWVIDPAMDDAFHLVGAEAAGVKPSLVTAVYARHVAVAQFPDGHWETLDARPPQSCSPVSATMISLRAIQLYGHPSQDADTRARIDKARQWLEARKTRNTEERSAQLMGLRWAGSSAELRSRLGAELLAAQQQDGGWASLEGRSSDAYSTGQALVALADGAGVAASDAAWQRGISFLVSTQKPDGSWHVPSRLHPPAPVSPPYFETGYPYGHDQFLSAMAASYAVMALARSLGPASAPSLQPLREAEPVNVEPWAETVLFGSAADVRALLDDKKMEANAATKSGTTALMMAAPDLEKTRLLLDRGANAEARAKNRYSALLVAAGYPGSAAVVRLLLDRGAKIQLPQGAGRPMFNATALNHAVFTRDAELVRTLLDAGDRPDAPMYLLGMVPAFPVLTAVSFGDTASIAALLDKGTPVDYADEGGTTLLAWAAILNRSEAARLLLGRGAKVNAVDKSGMTPLLYAASIDFGDTEMIDLLLKAGADPKARTKDGLTALDLARKYQHRTLIPVLTASR